MLNHLHPAAIVFTVGAAAMGVGAVSAQSKAELESSVAAAKSAGTLNAVVTDLVKTASPESLAVAMVNQNVAYSDAIAALLAAGVPPARVSSAMYAAVPASDVAALDLALGGAGLPLAATGAGPGTGTGNAAGGVPGGAGPAPFVGSTIGGGGGGGTTASVS